MNLSEKYLSLEKELAETKEKLKSSMKIEKGQLVLFKGTHYRAKYVFIDDKKGIPYISLKEIRNYSVNWESCSTPKIYYGDEYEVVDWTFDWDKMQELEEQYYKTDSVSEKEKLKEEIENMYLSCHHEWDKHNIFDDNYYCKHCGCETFTRKTKDWLNGEKEQADIDLPI